MVTFPPSVKVEYLINKLLSYFRKFKFQNKTYNYFVHSYNSTWRNERAVEIPIMWELVRKNKRASILEIGNVLSHYFAVNHDIVDKYENGPRVINVDIEKYKPGKKYDLIISISTLEHIGGNKKTKDSNKIMSVLKKLKKYLKPNGKIVFTVPVGYNSNLDKVIKSLKIKSERAGFLKRISNYPNANAVAIFVVKNEFT